MKTVVLTGATSFLGRNLLKGLLKNDYKVYALVRHDSPTVNKIPQDGNLKIIYGSLENLEIINDYVGEADYFIHFAWEGADSLGRENAAMQRRNIQYSLKTLQIAYNLGCKAFFFSGSQAEYGSKKNKIYELDECMPISEYGKAKLEFSKRAMEICNEKRIKFIHLRIFSVYGPGDRGGTLVNSCIKKFNTGEFMMLGPCIQKWNFLYIKDFVHIMLNFLKNDCESAIYNIASYDTRILKEFVLEIYEASNKTGSYEFGDVLQNPEGSPSLDPDVGRMLAVTGDIELTSFKSGIEETMKNILTKEDV